ncbi:MAG: RpiB/LacA/LacB family sugar-phosphate isomerase [Dehalococcoidia bacterium]|nr:RpiB/LacA/LacB family sugar-phosphate isomerase [Dehalococcoidia bacterium]MDW8120361.1 RpiB/LacA/LacB family sugar-phosphate isomerase [Chloroflexota bacterium]
MRIAIGSDEATPLTTWVLEHLRRLGHQVVPFGALREGDNPNWPVVAQRVGEAVASGECQQGILFCWTGTGVCMAANKVPGVRAALCPDAPTAAGARKWNDANVLCMSLRLTTPAVAQEILDAWFTAQPDPSEEANITWLKERDTLSARLGR